MPWMGHALWCGGRSAYGRGRMESFYHKNPPHVDEWLGTVREWIEREEDSAAQSVSR